MKTSTLLGTLLVTCGLALSAAAQDSTSIHLGLPGDAPDAYEANDQCASYVLDLATISTTWGNEFTMGPLMKATRTAPFSFFNNLTSSYGVSATYANTSFSGQSFPVWNAPGFGVASGDNTPSSSSVTPTGSAIQFAAVVSDFSNNAGSTASTENIIGTVVKIDPSNPTRLFVQRRIAVTNGFNNSETRSAFGIGSVNEQGQIALRAEGFGTTGPNAIVGNNLFVVNLLNRNCSLVNVIDLDGGNDAGATTDILRGESVNHSPPSILPASVRASTIFGPNFGTQLRFGDGSSTSTTTAHRPGTSDQRGTTTYSPAVWVSGSSGTGAVLSKPSGLSGNPTAGISYWGVDGSNGGVFGTAPNVLTLPSVPAVGGTVTDNFDGYQIGLPADPQSDWEYTHVFSQTAFRGGNGRVAVNTDQQGNLLLAAVAGDGSQGGRAGTPVNAITVARVSPSGGVEWTIAGWTDLFGPNGGKAVTDGQGNVVGFLAELGQLTNNNPLGPSITTPAIDSAGNVWFVAPGRFIDPDSPTGFSFSSALFRAVYDASTFSYELEAVVRVRDIARGINSDTDYRIDFLSIANSTGNSINSGAFTSNSLIHEQWLGGNDQLAKGDPRALGGLVFATQIIYDTNNDGNFVSPSDDPSSPDEVYQVLMFVGVPTGLTGGECLGDIADDFGFTVADGGGPDGVVDFGDFVALLGLIGSCPGGVPGCLGDIADDFGFTAADGGGPDGVVDFGDFVALLGLIGPCP